MGQNIRFLDGFKKTSSEYEIQLEKIAAVLYSELPLDTAGIWSFAKVLYTKGVRVEKIDNEILSDFRNYGRKDFGEEYA